MRKDYNKLVRDKIPEIIAESGAKCETRVLDIPEYTAALRAKLREEIAEYEESGELDELADIIEVVYALARASGHGREALEAARANKAAARGGFVKRLLLLSVEEGE